jgi:hypothetical protein
MVQGSLEITYLLLWSIGDHGLWGEYGALVRGEGLLRGLRRGFLVFLEKVFHGLFKEIVLTFFQSDSEDLKFFDELLFYPGIVENFRHEAYII